MHNISRYFKIYLLVTKVSILTELEYRIDFFVNFLGASLRIVTFWIFVEVIFNQVNILAGWSRYEIILILGFYRFFATFLRSTVLDNLRDMSYTIIDGQLDHLLLKPINTRFLLSTRKFFFFEFSKSITGFILIIYALSNLHFQISIEKIALITFSAVLLAITFYSIVSSFMTLTFWLGRIGHGYWIYESLTDMAQLPNTAFEGIWAILFLYFLPFVMFGAVPAGILLGKIDYIYLFYLCIIGVLWYLFSGWIWRKGIKNYSSSGG